MVKNNPVIYGTAKVGEKGQIVIPSDARKDLGLSSGDVVVVLGKKDKGLGIIKADDLGKVLSSKFSELVKNG